MVHLTSEDTPASVSQASLPPDAPLDLQQFCSADAFRYNLHKPFRRNGFVYATNGHILIRVADDEQYEAGKIAVEKVLDEPIERAEFVAPPTVSIPPKPPTVKVACPDCNGRGTDHDCPDCECDCETCDGKGTIIDDPDVSTALCGHFFNIDYIRQIYTLPELEIAPGGVKIDGVITAPLFFRFAGGIGAVMPMRSKYESHVEIEPARDGEANHAA